MLVSLLISVFAITMLATMISTAMTLVKRSNEVTYSYLEVGNDLISPGKDSELKAVKETGTVTIKVTGLVNSTGTTDTDTESTGTDGVAMRLRNSDTAETTVVYYYTNSSISGNNVTAYYVKSED